MKDQLRLLIELQVHDAKIQELETALKTFPAQFEAAASDVKRVEAMLERERNQLSETEAWRKRQEDEARDQEDALIRAKQRSSMVKNVKEHMANERELEANRKSAQAREDEAKRLAEAVTNAKKSLAQHEGELTAMKEHVANDESSSRGKMTELEKEIATAQGARSEAASRVDPAALKRYSSIRMRRGLALAPVKAGTCQGCHMNIPPQLFNILQRATTIETCPNCNRIIYWDRLMADPDGEAADKAPNEKVVVKAAKAPKAPKAPKPAASTSEPTAPRPAPAPRAEPAKPVQLAAPAGSMPGAEGIRSAATLPSSSTPLPDRDADAGDAPDGDEPETSPSV